MPVFPPVSAGRDHVALLRQAPNNWNFDYTYDKKGISARMGLTHNDANIFAYQFQDGANGGIKGPAGDQYLHPHTQVDAQVSYWIPRARGLQAIVSMLNLNNEVFGSTTAVSSSKYSANITAARSHWACAGHQPGSGRNSQWLPDGVPSLLDERGYIADR
jgi:hypothetical protein